MKMADLRIRSNQEKPPLFHSFVGKDSKEKSDFRLAWSTTSFSGLGDWQADKVVAG